MGLAHFPFASIPMLLGEHIGCKFDVKTFVLECWRYPWQGNVLMIILKALENISVSLFGCYKLIFLPLPPVLLILVSNYVMSIITEIMWRFLSCLFWVRFAIKTVRHYKKGKEYLHWNFMAWEQSGRGADLFGWKGPSCCHLYRFNLGDFFFLCKCKRSILLKCMLLTSHDRIISKYPLLSFFLLLIIT